LFEFSTSPQDTFGVGARSGDDADMWSMPAARFCNIASDQMIFAKSKKPSTLDLTWSRWNARFARLHFSALGRQWQSDAIGLPSLASHYRDSARSGRGSHS
jgi:hypothetical protein